MSVQRIASRYGKSLIDLAKDQNKLDEILEDIKVFRETCESRDFVLLLKSPIIHAAKKREIFQVIFKGKLDELTLSFFDIILRKGREFYLREIADSFVEQYNEINEISVVTLTTATPLSQDHLEKIRQRIRESGITHPNIDLKVHVDAGIIGGFLIEFEDKLYDASVARHINMLRKEIESDKYIKA
jgi:F-type H+-transporting ATPase subunit delta